MKYSKLLLSLGILLSCLSACQPKKTLPTINWEISFDSLVEKIADETTVANKLQTVQKIIADHQLSDSTRSHAYFILGQLHLFTSNNDEAAQNIRKSLSFLPDNQPSVHKARNLHTLGLIALDKKKLYLANYYISQAAELIIQNNYSMKYPRAASLTLAMAANLNRYVKSFANALKYAKAYSRFYEQGISDKENAVTTRMIIAEIYSDPSIQNLDSSNHYLNQVTLLKDSLQANSEKLTKNIIYLKAGIFFNQERYDSCLYYQNLITAKDAYSSYSKSVNLIALYAELGKMDSARFYLEYANDHYLPRDEADTLHYLENKTHYLIAVGKSDSALIAFKKLQDMIEQKQINESVRAINELSTVYSLQSKESKIKKLTKMVDAVQFTLERRNLYLIGLGVLLFLSLIVIAFVIALTNRRKLKAENQRISALNNKVDLEQRLLRSQMNPHFIFNSLGKIQSFIRHEKKSESLSYLSLFSKLLRGSLESSRATSITLEGEVKLLEKYLQLQQLGKANSFSYNISLSNAVEEEIELLEIPPMLIQPFVENSILHGIREMESDGEIAILIDLIDDLLSVQILDNGKGLGNQTNLNHESHAISIVKERLEIIEQLAHKPARLSIQNRTDSFGVLVELSVPLIF